MKIVFIPNLPYTFRDHLRFGVEYYESEGYDVEVMDVHKILIPGYKEKVKIDYYYPEKHWEPNSQNDVITRVKGLSKNDFIFFYIGGVDAVKLLNMMKLNTNAKFITYTGGSIPTSSIFYNYFDFVKYKTKQLVKKIIPKYRKTFATDYYVSGSPKDTVVYPELITKKTKIIKSNSRDYNKCLDSTPFFSSRKYCVFLDTDVIDASDYILLGYKGSKDIDGYLSKLEIFFSWIQHEFDLDVIISAHPKSRIFKNREHLNGVNIVHGKSVELVQGSEFVINEGTTAISYAIFFDKPLAFFTFDEISFFYKHCFAFAKVLNKKIIDIDNLSKIEFEKELLNMVFYKNYKFNYLTYNDDRNDTFEMLENSIFKKNT